MPHFENSDYPVLKKSFEDVTEALGDFGSYSNICSQLYEKGNCSKIIHRPPKGCNSPRIRVDQNLVFTALFIVDFTEFVIASLPQIFYK